ncbi:MAG: hypothetical protein KJ718_04035 [Nanoarchaeota archaeon]|nr:hypothetical protein [Nanoarchaeota archaeon]MBU1051698.1 hypothetical protein [Nanoarchaeota archaeon]MBU1987904.1 hypothetical protein [Nanoarchaeota archaeon]
MKRLNRKAQGIFGLSFGAIFSIFIIALIIAVAFFAINHFLSLNKCTQVGFFYNNLQREVEKAWTSGIYGDAFNGSLPQSGLLGTKIKKVCFGRLDSSFIDDPAVNNELLTNYLFNPSENKNIFLYPPEEACDKSLATFNLRCREGKSECMTTSDRFFCVNVVKGKVSVFLRKGDTEALVKVSDSWT